VRPLSNYVSADQDHWRRRELETEQKLCGADSEKLRILYAELVLHYRRMGALFDIPAKVPHATPEIPS
jgi:hypothetical protein